MFGLSWSLVEKTKDSDGEKQRLYVVFYMLPQYVSSDKTYNLSVLQFSFLVSKFSWAENERQKHLEKFKVLHIYEMISINILFVAQIITLSVQYLV